MDSVSRGGTTVLDPFAARCRRVAGYFVIGGLAWYPLAEGSAQEHAEFSTNGTVVAAADWLASGVSPGDDHGDTSATATLLALGSTLPGQIDSDSDADVFRIDVPGHVGIEVRTVGQTDTAGELLDSTGARLMSDDNAGPGDNFAMTVDLEPGVYYVHVRGDTGDYSVNARLGGAPDHGDTIESSTLLKLHSEGELAAVRPQVLLATAGRIYPSTDDVDVFRIDVPANATDITVRTSGSVDTYASLTDSADNEIASHDGDANARIDQVLDTGIYYVKVRGHGTGAYRVLGSMAPATLTTPPADTPAIEITDSDVECIGRLVGDTVNVTLTGTVSANRSVTDLELTGYANEHRVGSELIGSLSAGESHRFDLSGSYTYDGNPSLSCRIEARWEEGGGGQAPDLVVESPAVDDATPDAGAQFTFSAVVRNRGSSRAGSTTLRYYRSSNSTISPSDGEVGTDAVAGLAASATANESIRLTAPSNAGTYYYGACVDAVSGESSTTNNCSDGVAVEVGGGGADSYCRDGDTIGRGERCDVYSTDAYFEVNSDGQGCIRNVPGISDLCLGSNLRIQGGNVRIYADRSGSSYELVDVEPEPSD